MCARATSLERPLRSCHLPQAFRALAPVAQWIEQRFPNSSEGGTVDAHPSDVAAVSDPPTFSSPGAKPAIAGDETILDTSLTDVVEMALANALSEATRAARWDVVAQLARELEARRMARAAPNVVAIDREGRGGRRGA